MGGDGKRGDGCRRRGERRGAHALSDLLDRDAHAEKARLVHVPEAPVANLGPLALGRELGRVEVRTHRVHVHVARGFTARDPGCRDADVRDGDAERARPRPRQALDVRARARAMSGCDGERWEALVPRTGSDGSAGGRPATFSNTRPFWFGIFSRSALSVDWRRIPVRAASFSRPDNRIRSAPLRVICDAARRPSATRRHRRSG